MAQTTSNDGAIAVASYDGYCWNVLGAHGVLRSFPSLSLAYDYWRSRHGSSHVLRFGAAQTRDRG
jgi:hypothetical protein